MKRPTQRVLMSLNQIEVSSPSPHPQPLPTRGRGGALSVGVGAGGGRRVPPSPLWGELGWGALGKRIRQEGNSPMKPLFPHGLMSLNQIEVSSPAPNPQPLPTRGRGSALSVGLCAGGGRRVPPSPLWGGMGWGASGKGRDG